MVVKVTALRTDRLYSQEMLLVLISVMSRPQGHSAIGRILCQWKITMTLSGIEPATFRFVAQHLNHCATAVFLSIYVHKIICSKSATGWFQWQAVWRRSLAGIAGFEFLLGHGCLFLVSIVCCQVQVSAMGWALVQRSPTDCACVCVCVIECGADHLSRGILLTVLVCVCVIQCGADHSSRGVLLTLLVCVCVCVCHWVWVWSLIQRNLTDSACVCHSVWGWSLVQRSPTDCVCVCVCVCHWVWVWSLVQRNLTDCACVCVCHSVWGWSLVQRSPTDCACVCVCHWVWSDATITNYTYIE